MFATDAQPTTDDASAGVIDQTLALLGDVLGVELVSFEQGVSGRRWVSRDLPATPLPVVKEEQLILDARTTLRYARHPVVTAGVTSLVGVPLDGGATLWVGAMREGSFDARTVRHVAKWGRLLDKQREPTDDGRVYRRFITMMATPAVYIADDRVFINRAAETLIGYRNEEVATLESWFSRLYGADAPTVRAMHEIDRQQRLGTSRVTTLRRKDGTDRMVEFGTRRDGAHEIWLMHDVTERVASQERFRVLFEQSSTALALYDEGGFIDCNPAAVALLGYGTRAEVLHRRPADVSPVMQPCGQSSDEMITRMENIALTQGSHRFDWVYRTIHGDDAQVEVTLTPLNLGQRRVLLAEWHDISERLRYEEGLETARDSALAFARARSDFLATMSHEIRTPMNGVIGMTRLLSETTMTPQQREYVDTVRACGEGLLALINDILDFSRLEAGKVQLERIPFSVREVMEDALAVVAPQAHGKGLELTSRIDVAVPALVWGDPTRLRQVLLNLLSNAVKFTTRGHVELALSCHEHLPGDVELSFRVTDTGVGIAAEALPRLFSAFTQEDSSTTRRFGGSGLGLVICKGLTQLMQGTLSVDSSPAGSTFTVQVVLPPHTQAQTRPDLRGHRVAVLEDRPASRASLVSQLEAVGVTLVDDVAQAEVVLVEQGTQGGEGAALAAKLVHEGKKVGLLRRLDGSHLEETGASFVLPTPVRENALHRQLARLLLATPVPSSERAEYRQFKARVLVAEDNPVNQRVVSGLLKKLGCEVELASDGSRAVEAWRQGAFDLVFMDCQMPELDGFEATRRIRATQQKHVPIVALTAGVMEGDRERCLAAGMDAFLSKPVRLEELERALAQHLPR